MRHLPFLALTMGDPAGIGPEIIIKAMDQKRIWRVCRPLIVGSFSVMEKTRRSLKSHLKAIPLNPHSATSDQTAFSPGYLPILDPLPHTAHSYPKGKAGARAGTAAIECIKTAVTLARHHHVSGIVTAPINKEAINLGGYHYPGHTELLADLTRSREVGMMILGGPLKILFSTTHVSIRDLPKILTSRRISRTIRLAHMAMQKYFSLPKPRIGVAALNPHAGEAGLFGQEEGRVIAPAVKKAQRGGIDAIGPLPADTLFGAAARGEYDVVVAMYHDQGLIPLKLLAFGKSVNLTVGLPILRTSVDHGTAYDIVGKNKADPHSLIEAIKLAAKLADPVEDDAY